MDDTSSSLDAGPPGKGARGARNGGWDERLTALTSGWRRGTNGLALALLGGGVLAVTTVNGLSLLHDMHRLGEQPPAYDPFLREYTSGLGLFLAFVLMGPVFQLRPQALGWPRFLAVHAAATIAWSAIHLLVMVGLRHLVWGLLGGRYDFDFAGDWLYEYRKDVMIYVLAGAIAWVAPQLRPKRAPVDAGEVRLPDGSRSARFPIAAIEAAEACGNYVEVKLADGRRPLVRATLASVQAALEPHGFLRTHRSWLVRQDLVAAIAGTGAGDYVLTLKSGLSVPLSRRFPTALGELRARLES